MIYMIGSSPVARSFVRTSEPQTSPRAHRNILRSIHACLPGGPTAVVCLRTRHEQAAAQRTEPGGCFSSEPLLPEGSDTAGANSPPRSVSCVSPFIVVPPRPPPLAAATAPEGVVDSLVPLLRRFSVEATVAATLPGAGSCGVSGSGVALCLFASLGSFSSLWHGQRRGCAELTG